MGKYSARKRSGPKKQSFKKRKYNKKMVGGNQDETEKEKAAAKIKEEEQKAEVEAAKKDAPVVEAVPEAAVTSSNTNIKTDWDTLIEALIAANNKESIEKLLKDFGNKYK